MTVGQTVRFVNNDPDSIVIMGPKSASNQLQHGAYFQYTVSKSGTYTFSTASSNLTVTVTK